MTHHSLGNLNQAVIAYKKLVASNPSYALETENKILSVIYFFSQGKISEALDTIDSLIKINSNDSILYRGYSNWCLI